MTLEEVRPDPWADLLASLADLPRMGEWVQEAACAGQPEVFAPTRKPDGEEMTVIERVCRRCDVRTQCGDYADSTTVYGIWSGRWHEGDRRSRVAA